MTRKSPHLATLSSKSKDKSEEKDVHGILQHLLYSPHLPRPFITKSHIFPNNRTIEHTPGTPFINYSNDDTFPFISTLYLFPPALLAFPGLDFAPPLAPPPFIFLTENPDKSPLLIASPLFLNLFLPP